MSTEPIQILLVEDNLGDARLLYEGLTEVLPPDFQMAHIRRLSEALEWLWEKECDVVLLDLGLPDSHGLDTLSLMRAQAPKLPIVVLTGFQDDALAVEAIKKGAQDYLVKEQVDGKLLARSMRYAIERKKAEEVLVQQAFTLARAEEGLRRSRRRIITRQEGRRRDIATQLHRRVQERLLSLRSLLQELLRGTSLPSETAHLLSAGVTSLDQTVQRELSVLIRQLYPYDLSQGLVPALRSLVEQFKPALAVEMELDKELVQRELADHNLVPEPVRLLAYRIAEEALTNVLNHAKVDRVTLRLDLPSEELLRLTVRDKGQGFMVEDTSRGVGIAVMQDYAEAMGGGCVVRSALGSGTEVTATLPFVGPWLWQPEKGSPSGVD
jgi:signal transduction histidine kinase